MAKNSFTQQILILVIGNSAFFGFLWLLWLNYRLAAEFFWPIIWAMLGSTALRSTKTLCVDYVEGIVQESDKVRGSFKFIRCLMFPFVLILNGLDHLLTFGVFAHIQDSGSKNHPTGPSQIARQTFGAAKRQSTWLWIWLGRLYVVYFCWKSSIVLTVISSVFLPYALWHIKYYVDFSPLKTQSMVKCGQYGSTAIDWIDAVLFKIVKWYLKRLKKYTDSIVSIILIVTLVSLIVSSMTIVGVVVAMETSTAFEDVRWQIGNRDHGNRIEDYISDLVTEWNITQQVEQSVDYFENAYPEYSSMLNNAMQTLRDQQRRAPTSVSHSLHAPSPSHRIDGSLVSLYKFPDLWFVDDGFETMAKLMGEELDDDDQCALVYGPHFRPLDLPPCRHESLSDFYGSLARLWKEPNEFTREFASCQEPKEPTWMHTFVSTCSSYWSVVSYFFESGSTVLEVMSMGVSFMVKNAVLMSTSVFNFSVSVLLFFTLSYYLLAAKKDVVSYLTGIVPLQLGQRKDISEALSKKLQSFFVTSLKLMLFNGLYTWLSLSLFSLHFRFSMALLSACACVLPFVPSWLTMLSGCLELMIGGNVYGAILLALIGYIIPAYVIGIELFIYDEIESMHPKIIGLSVVAGLSAFGLQGAVCGPVLVVVATFVFNLLRGVVAEEERQQNSQDLHAINVGRNGKKERTPQPTGMRTPRMKMMTPLFTSKRKSAVLPPPSGLRSVIKTPWQREATSIRKSRNTPRAQLNRTLHRRAPNTLKGASTRKFMTMQTPLISRFNSSAASFGNDMGTCSIGPPLDSEELMDIPPPSPIIHRRSSTCTSVFSSVMDRYDEVQDDDEDEVYQQENVKNNNNYNNNNNNSNNNNNNRKKKSTATYPYLNDDDDDDGDDDDSINNHNNNNSNNINNNHINNSNNLINTNKNSNSATANIIDKDDGILITPTTVSSLVEAVIDDDLELERSESDDNDDDNNNVLLAAKVTTDKQTRKSRSSSSDDSSPPPSLSPFRRLSMDVLFQ